MRTLMSRASVIRIMNSISSSRQPRFAIKSLGHHAKRIMVWATLFGARASFITLMK